MLNIGAYISLQTSPRADAGGVGPITNYNMLHFAIQQMLQQDPTRTLLGFRGKRAPLANLAWFTAGFDASLRSNQNSKESSRT